jgi:hypothetical protein
MTKIKTVKGAKIGTNSGDEQVIVVLQESKRV